MFFHIYRIFILFFLIFNCSFLPAYSIEEYNNDDLSEIILEPPAESVIDEILKKEDKRPLASKILHTKSDFWHLFSNRGYDFESGPVKNFKINGYFRFDNEMQAKRHEEFSSKMTYDSVELQTETLFRDNKTKLSASYNFVRDLDYNNDFFEKVSNLYIDHTFNKNQTLRIGNARVPVGIEGGMSSSAILFVSRGQISRNFGDARSVGIRNIAKYKYLDYDIGLYDSSRFMQRMFQGQEFAGNIAVKPISHYNDKYGKLKLGASIDVGDADNAYSVFNTYAQYQYKKLYMDFEYGKANGSGGKYIKRTNAHGFFTTLAYKITPRTEILGRYDFYRNENLNKLTQEYTAGINYYTHPNAKIVLNYVYSISDTSSVPSHRIYMGTRFSTSSLLGDI